jgi:hypothetical protein
MVPPLGSPAQHTGHRGREPRRRPQAVRSKDAGGGGIAAPAGRDHSTSVALPNGGDGSGIPRREVVRDGPREG